VHKSLNKPLKIECLLTPLKVLLDQFLHLAFEVDIVEMEDIIVQPKVEHVVDIVETEVVELWYVFVVIGNP